MPGSAVADGTARALELLELLQSAHVRTVGELAERLGVDERTVRRDVRRLVEIGLPVESLRGRYGGYRLAPGRRVLPLMFTSEEAVAVFLGLSRGHAATAGPLSVVVNRPPGVCTAPRVNNSPEVHPLR